MFDWNFYKDIRNIPTIIIVIEIIFLIRYFSWKSIPPKSDENTVEVLFIGTIRDTSAVGIAIAASTKYVDRSPSREYVIVCGSCFIVFKVVSS